MAIWSDIITGITGPVADYFKTRQENKTRENIRKMELADALQQRQISLISQGLTADMNWEMAFANQAATSWKDEFELLVLTIPLVMCFVPGLSQYVLDGFKVLAQCPQWFLFLVISIYLANYGIRYWRKTQSDT